MIPFILNLPWTIIGLLAAIPSGPKSFSISRKPFALVIQVRSFWWCSWLPGYKKMTGLTAGSVVLVTDENTLAHELIHVEQFVRVPLIFPILYIWDYIKHGYQQNKYEAEAYDRSGSRYEGL